VYTTGSSFHMATATCDLLPAATIWFNVCMKGLSVEFKLVPHKRSGARGVPVAVGTGDGVTCSGLALLTASKYAYDSALLRLNTTHQSTHTPVGLRQPNDGTRVGGLGEGDAVAAAGEVTAVGVPVPAA